MADDYAEEIKQSMNQSWRENLRMSLEGWRKMHGLPPLTAFAVDAATVLVGIALIVGTGSTVAMVIGVILAVIGAGSITYHLLRGESW